MRRTHLFEETQSHTRTQEFAQMLAREGVESLQDMLLDDLGLTLGVVEVVGNDGRCEIGVVHGVVDGDGNLEFRLIVYDSTCDTRPHRLYHESELL